MKATAPTISTATPAEKGRVAVYSELFKARLTALVMLTNLVGFYMGQRGEFNYGLLFHTLIGTGLLACGAAALNQLLEQRFDALMTRTEDRPLPSGRLQPDAVLMIGGVTSAIGLVYLALAVNNLTALLGIATIGSYLFVYTPLKRKTTLNTIIGAIPGALPPLMGWTAARGEISAGGWSLFLILFFWQLPHFLAIAWMYRDDYARAGFVMLPVVDPDGTRTGMQAVGHTLGLMSISLFPAVLGLTGVVYGLGAVILGAAFFWGAVRFARRKTRDSARLLFFFSILYLPLLLGLMVFDKIKH